MPLWRRRLCVIGLTRALTHGRQKLPFDAVLSQIDLSIGRQVKLYVRRLADGGDDVVFVNAAFEHVDDLLIGESWRRRSGA
jgi:ABC-type Na+ transport system ATPase subunit NatA